MILRTLCFYLNICVSKHSIFSNKVDLSQETVFLFGQLVEKDL